MMRASPRGAIFSSKINFGTRVCSVRKFSASHTALHNNVKYYKIRIREQVCSLDDARDFVYGQKDTLRDEVGRDWTGHESSGRQLDPNIFAWHTQDLERC